MPADNTAGDFRLPEVDRLIHEPARYNIMALLYVVERAEFLFLQNHINLTPGNLSTHLNKLETAGYLTIEKEFVGKRPKTFLSLTDAGRRAFKEYREKMLEAFSTTPKIPKQTGNE